MAYAAAIPTPAEVATQLGAPEAEVVAALNAELSDQTSRCRVEPYTAALREAVIRRVARHLAMRAIPLGVSAQEFGAMYVGEKDPVVQRLEAPYRRVIVGAVTERSSTPNVVVTRVDQVTVTVPNSGTQLVAASVYTPGGGASYDVEFTAQASSPSPLGTEGWFYTGNNPFPGEPFRGAWVAEPDPESVGFTQHFDLPEGVNSISVGAVNEGTPAVTFTDLVLLVKRVS